MDPGRSANLPDREQLVKVIESAQAAQKAQSTADDLMAKAKKMTDSSQREKILKEAYDKEIEAHGHSKMAQRMQSGTWQGLGFGGGIGAATGMGIGAGLGTLLGAITAVPMTGIGMLVGSATGAIHGPWITLGGKEQKFEDADPNEVADALQQERNSRATVLDEEQATTLGDQEMANPQSAEFEKQRRKPKKLEIRSQSKPLPEEQLTAANASVISQGNKTEHQKQKRKPKKLEIRSRKQDFGDESMLK